MIHVKNIIVFAVVFLIWSAVIRASYATMTKSHFQKSPVCNIQESINKNCSHLIWSIRSRLECIGLCNQDPTCLGISLNDVMECFFHKECGESILCDQDDRKYTSYVKSDRNSLCCHGYRWHFQRKRCYCREGWIGDFCDRLAESCDDIHLDGYPTTTEHDVALDIKDGGEPINVICFLKKTLSTWIKAFRTSGQAKFNRTWDEYETGFGENGQDMWIGLKNIYRLNQVGYNSLHISLEMQNYTFHRIRREYIGTTFENSLGKYAFSFTKAIRRGGPVKSLENCFEQIKNVQFSTWDSDNDGDPSKNCASDLGAGWWYPTCNVTCNLAAYKSGDPIQGVDSDTVSTHLTQLILKLKRH